MIVNTNEDFEYFQREQFDPKIPFLYFYFVKNPKNKEFFRGLSNDSKKNISANATQASDTSSNEVHPINGECVTITEDPNTIQGSKCNENDAVIDNNSEAASAKNDENDKVAEVNTASGSGNSSAVTILEDLIPSRNTNKNNSVDFTELSRLIFNFMNVSSTEAQTVQIQTENAPKADAVDDAAKDEAPVPTPHSGVLSF